jgi:hypothetical protein
MDITTLALARAYTDEKVGMSGEDLETIKKYVDDKIEEKLEEAKNSGEFDGPPYELTNSDKENIANIVLNELP